MVGYRLVGFSMPYVDTGKTLCLISCYPLLELVGLLVGWFESLVEAREEPVLGFLLALNLGSVGWLVGGFVSFVEPGEDWCFPFPFVCLYIRY